MMLANRSPKGFTVIEVTVASWLMVVLAVVLSLAWVSVGRGTVDVIARAQLAQEMDFAVAALSRDLGGCVVNSTGQLATTAFPVSSVTPNPNVTPDPNRSDPTSSFPSSVKLTLDNHDTITYQMNLSDTNAWKQNNLIRIYRVNGADPGSTFTVARNVDTFQASWNSAGTELSIRIDFSCNYRPTDHTPTSDDRLCSIVKRTCVLVAGRPQ
jgi:hypothetical protein